MYDPALGRWHVIDNKAEKYSSISPFAYALNNPIIFLDPDGNEVIIHHMRMAIIDKFMATSSGQNFINQFLEKGETVKIRMEDGSLQNYNFSGSGKNNSYSNSTLRIAALDMPSRINGVTLAYHSDGSRLFRPRETVDKSDLGKLQTSKKFELRIGLNGNLDRSDAEWAETLGHEVFVHGVDAASAIQKVIDALVAGVSEDDLNALIGTLNAAGGNAEDEHDMLNAGNDEDYNEYMRELTKEDDDE